MTHIMPVDPLVERFILPQDIFSFDGGNWPANFPSRLIGEGLQSGQGLNLGVAGVRSVSKQAETVF
jgi:hypothetical protein